MRRLRVKWSKWPVMFCACAISALEPHPECLFARAVAKRAAGPHILQLYYLNCGAGLRILEGHLQKHTFLRGTEEPSVDDFTALEKVEAGGHDLSKYPFPEVRKRIERLKQAGNVRSSCDNGLVQVQFLEHSPVNMAYIEKQQAFEEEEFKYEVKKPSLQVFEEDSVPGAVQTRCKTFSIEKGVFEKLPGLHIVTALVTNARNIDEEGVLRGHFESVCKMIGDRKLEKRGRLEVWKRYTSDLQDRGPSSLFLTKGARRDPPVQSVQAMWSRLEQKGKSFSVNPLVDFYNTLSIKHVITGGGFDLEAMPGDLRLGLSKRGDRFLALDKDESGPPVEVDVGEVNYVVEGASTEITGNVVTRHLAYKQSRLGLIQERSRDVFLMFEMPPDFVDEVVPELIKDLRRLPHLYKEGKDASVYIRVLNASRHSVLIAGEESAVHA